MINKLDYPWVPKDDHSGLVTVHTSLLEINSSLMALIHTMTTVSQYIMIYSNYKTYWNKGITCWA